MFFESSRRLRHCAETTRIFVCGKVLPTMAMAVSLLLVSGGWLSAERVSQSLPHPEGLGKIALLGYAFDDRVHSIRIVDQGALEHPKFANMGEAMHAVGAVAGINGGFFDPLGAPLGMMIADGVQSGKLAHSALTSGVLCRSPRGLQLLRSKEYSARPRPDTSQLVQAGPFLVDAGTRVTGLDDTKARVRSLIMHDNAHLWLIAFTSSVTLADLGNALATQRKIGNVRIVRALNLDGGSSTAFWLAGAQKKSPWKPVRNYIAVVPK